MLSLIHMRSVSELKLMLPNHRGGGIRTSVSGAIVGAIQLLCLDIKQLVEWHRRDLLVVDCVLRGIGLKQIIVFVGVAISIGPCALVFGAQFLLAETLREQEWLFKQNWLLGVLVGSLFPLKSVHCLLERLV